MKNPVRPFGYGAPLVGEKVVRVKDIRMHSTCAHRMKAICLVFLGVSIHAVTHGQDVAPIGDGAAIKRRTKAVCLTAIVLSATVSMANAQKDIRATPSRSSQGFAQTVSELIADMKGAWKIKSANLRGGDLPLEQFDSLAVDESGFTLNVQNRERRFEFQQFCLDTRTFYAVCSSKDYPKGLIYEIRVSGGIVKIRYRVDGAHVAPEQNTADDQLVVQEWVSDAERSPSSTTQDQAAAAERERGQQSDSKRQQRRDRKRQRHQQKAAIKK